MKVLKRLRITVTSPFSGGKVMLFDGAKRVLPDIHLPGLIEATFDHIRFPGKKGSYSFEYQEQDLPYIIFQYKFHWELEGEPRESIKVEETMRVI